MLVVAIADVAMDAACEYEVLDHCCVATGVVMSYCIGAHSGGPSAFVKVAHPRSSPAMVSVAASVVSKHLTRNYEQVLNACGDAFTMLALNCIVDTLMAVSHSVSPDASNWVATSCSALTLRYKSSVSCADASSAC